MDILYWLWLSTIPHVGPITQKRLLEKFQTPESIFYSTEQELKQIPHISSNARAAILQARSLEKVKQVQDKIQKKKIKLLTYDNPYYPTFAKVCPESPVVLYYRGQLHYFSHTVGIVGARRCTKYGQKVAAQIAAELSKQNIPIISGLAKGIDGYAHTATIQNGGETIAFLASGVDSCYPPEHQKLYEKIIENGAVVSQYVPGTQPLPQHFLQRNLLISAWSKQLIIVEAGEKSGALTTAQFAHKYDREIFAVPNQIDIPEGKGTNSLLEIIAKPFIGIESLKLKNINKHTSIVSNEIVVPHPDPCPTPQKTAIKINHKSTESTESDSKESRLLTLLKKDPVKIADILKELNMSKSEFEELIFMMELDGKIKIKGEYIIAIFR